MRLKHFFTMFAVLTVAMTVLACNSSDEGDGGGDDPTSTAEPQGNGDDPTATPEPTETVATVVAAASGAVRAR